MDDVAREPMEQKEVAVSEAVTADLLATLADMSTPVDPYPVYARLRETNPVYWSDLIGSWVLTRYDDCVSVLRDPARFASDWRRIGEAMPVPMLSIQSLDPPEHTRIRHFMVDAVRTIDLDALRRLVADHVRDRINKLRAESDFDYITEFAAPLALDTITAVLGVPPLDAAWFLPLSQTIVDGMDAGIWPETAAPALAARAELADYAEGWLTNPPQEGLVGYVAANAADSGIPRAVLLNTLRTVLHAGFESASRMLGNGMVALLADRGALTRLTHGDISRAVEELARFDAPVQADARACVVRTRLGGNDIMPGDPVTMLLGAANRDPARFHDPDTLDLSRHPNPHLSFGRGTHACLGQPLAVLQAQAVFGTLVTECPRIRAVSPPVFRRNLTLRGVRRFQMSIN
jgi:cytochrome P450